MSEQAISTSSGQQEGRSADYGRYYYRHDCGIPYERNSHWLEFFGKVADGIVRDLRPTSVLDAGCAMGFLVEALRERGVEAWGIDVSEYAISQVHESAKEFCEVGSLAEPLSRRYDLIVSIEVLEHIPPTETTAAIANLCAATDQLLLSTTPDDYGEATHLNVQPPEAWSAALAQEGFLREVEHDVSYVTPWAGLYARKDEPVAEIVRRYDRSWARQRKEADQLRDSLLTAQERFAELEDQPAGTQPDLLAELNSRDQEILRLRDLLIGMDAELGTAKGRVAEMEDRMKRLDAAKLRIESGIPLGKLPGRLMRLFRSLRS
jgi:2-polyprenyl-3-methyl-5-hydroxy-6-metoxy-1,4-benzoquinol methylase